jgi:hypothetical protein
MLQKNGDFIFRASVISNSCAWQNVAEIGHFTTDARLIRRAGFRGMGVDQFLASKIYTAGFKQTDWRYPSRPILPFRQWVDVRRGIGDWPAGDLGVLDRALHVAPQPRVCWSR